MLAAKARVGVFTAKCRLKTDRSDWPDSWSDEDLNEFRAASLRRLDAEESEDQGCSQATWSSVSWSGPKKPRSGRPWSSRAPRISRSAAVTRSALFARLRTERVVQAGR